MMIRGTTIRPAAALGAVASAAAILTASMAMSRPADAHSGGDTQGAKVTIHRISARGIGKAVGTITLRDSPHGLLVIPNLKGLGEPRPHAAHVHANGTCAPAKRDGEMVAGAAAGGHYDPQGTGNYTGPYRPGALGDLPNLYVEPGGRSTIPVLAPKLSVQEVRGHALMIHAKPDRYGPRTAGGDGHGDHAHSHGGTRAYCGVIPEG